MSTHIWFEIAVFFDLLTLPVGGDGYHIVVTRLLAFCPVVKELLVWTAGYLVCFLRSQQYHILYTRLVLHMSEYPSSFTTCLQVKPSINEAHTQTQMWPY